MSNDIPTGFIANQPLTNPPITLDGTLVDDTSMLVDGTALVGSQTTITTAARTKAQAQVPRLEINISR